MSSLHCDYHADTPVEAEVKRETARFTYVTLRCPHVNRDGSTCNRIRGTRIKKKGVPAETSGQTTP